MLNVDSELTKRNAQPYPCCPVRREINSKAYDEFVKQLSANRSELGSLLQSVREATRAPVPLYENLLANSHLISFRVTSCPTDPAELLKDTPDAEGAAEEAEAIELPFQYRIEPRSTTNREDLMQALVAARLRNAALEERNRQLRAAIRTEADRADDAAAADAARHAEETAALKKATAQALVEAKRAQH